MVSGRRQPLPHPCAPHPVMTEHFRVAAPRLTVINWLSSNLRFAVSAAARQALDRRLRAGAPIPADFFGICVAGSVDPAIDDYLVSRLRALNLRAVRMDYTLPHPEPHEPRLLSRLLSEGFQVCLHPVDGQEIAAASERLAALENLLDRFGGGLALLELGSTVNRKRWFRHSLAEFLADYAAAYRLASTRGIAVAAPNVTDFEPVYNIVLLDTLRRHGIAPRYHSDNLFVERAGEPEQFDHKILGRRCAAALKFDLIRKARILQAVGRWAGISETISPHTAWSLRRIARFAGDIEEQQANYVSRYSLLAAASGALRQIYWGPLIGQREGLIDDGTEIYPAHLPHVTSYTRTHGSLPGFRQRPAFTAFQTVVAQLQGARFVRAVVNGPGLFLLAFIDRKGACLCAAWTRDGRRALSADVFPAAAMAGAQIFDRDGRQLAVAPETLSESPTYWHWPTHAVPEIRPGADCIAGVRFAGNAVQTAIHRLVVADWTGYATGSPGSQPPAATDPAGWIPPDETAVLRDARNLVWKQVLPWPPETPVAVKRFGAPRGWRLLLQCWKPTRARRSWNAAVELLRRGLPTPAPLAFMERRHQGARHASYFICKALETPYSVRSFFSAYVGGAAKTAGIAQADFFRQSANFVANMHGKGVFFRDLSAGNILVSITAAAPGAAAFSLIDTTRARFFPYPLDRRRRLCDLMRICHPLDTERRQQFLKAYLTAAGLAYRRWMQVPFWCYNAKHILKKRLRRRIRPSGLQAQ